MKVWLNDQEISGIEDLLSKDDVMLEWGSGGSTLHFSKQVKKYYSIEHHREWYDKVLPEALKIKSLEYYFVPPNYEGRDPGAKFNTAFDPAVHGKSTISHEKYDQLKKKWPQATESFEPSYSPILRYWQYKDYVDFISQLGVDKFDKILIDGRARAICAYTARKFMHEDSILFIDDFYRVSYKQPVRKMRYEVEFGDTFFDYFEKVARFDEMIVARIKE